MSTLRNQKGQSIIELALMTPLILIALYIPFDFGIGLYTGHLTQIAVRDAVRIGVTTKDPFDSTAANDVGDEALNRLPNMLTSPTVTVRYNATGTATCMKNVEVEAAGQYNFFLYQLLRMFGFTVPDSITISRATRMTYEFQPDTNGGSSSVTTTCTTPTLTVTRS